MLPDANGFIASRPVSVTDPEGWPVLWTHRLGDDHALQADAYYFPVLTNLTGAVLPNLSDGATSYLESLGSPVAGCAAELIWMHVLAICYSPEWLQDHHLGVRFDWPRVPLPDTGDALQASADRGRKVAALLDFDVPVSGVTQGSIEPALSEIATLWSDAATLDLNVREMWGSRDRIGRVTPTTGRATERGYLPGEGASASQAGSLGPTTFDVYLNDDTYWKNIPAAVWQCHIGGYRVLKKWLSYRSRNVTNAPMSVEEAAHFTSTARRLAKLYLMSDELNENYRSCRDAAYEYPLSSDEGLSGASADDTSAATSPWSGGWDLNLAPLGCLPSPAGLPDGQEAKSRTAWRTVTGSSPMAARGWSEANCRPASSQLHQRAARG